MNSKNHSVSIVIHGGAGTIVREKLVAGVEAAYRAKLEESVRVGHEVLSCGGSSLEAVTRAVMVMEDSELFNAGKGSVFTHEGTVEMDASIMEGNGLNAGAVAGITRVRNPVKLALEVMEHSSHVLLLAAGAERFAVSRGFQLVDNSWFHTERRRRQLLKAIESDTTALSEDERDEFDDRKHGTVGAVARDVSGNIAAATSTGGMTNKQFGRVGDSPLIGAGTYADNRAGGISATGHGEYFIRSVVAHDICARVRYKGLALQQAADELIQGPLREMGGDGGVVGIDSQGKVVYSYNSAGMYRASIDREGRLDVRIFET